MKKFTFLFLFLSSIIFSQTTIDKWYFGSLAGLNFTGGGPVPLTNGALLNTTEGTASMSDASGNLLFYTDGQTVWNKSHVAMTNGTGLFGNPSSTQVLIVPTPSNVNQYYIFTTDAQGGPNGLCYSIVDMTLSAGFGSVTTKNIQLLTPVCEKLAAIKSPFSSKYWLTCHAYGNNNFYSYEITNTGLQAPLISSVGITYDLSNTWFSIGQMKFSSCGNNLALAGGLKDTVEVFNFNQITGQITAPITIPLSGVPYGIEFSSPVTNMLYVATATATGVLAQYDLSAGSQSAINASKTILSSGNFFGALQLGPDGKIYESILSSKFVGVINNPMSPGTSCNFNLNGINIDPLSTGRKCWLGLPSFMIDNNFPCGVVGMPDEKKRKENVLVYPNPSLNEFNLKAKIGSVIQIYSHTGVLVDKFKTQDDNAAFGKNYLPGIYFVRINSEIPIKVIKD